MQNLRISSMQTDLSDCGKKAREHPDSANVGALIEYVREVVN